MPGRAEPGAKESRDRYACSGTPGRCRRSGGNRGAYRSEALSALLDEAGQTESQTRQADLYRQAQALLAEDRPYVSLWHEDRVWIAQSEIDGLSLAPSGSFRALLKARRVKR